MRKKDLQLKRSYSFFSTTVYSMCVVCVLQYVCCSVLRKNDLYLKGSYSFFSTTVYSMCVALCCSMCVAVCCGKKASNLRDRIHSSPPLCTACVLQCVAVCCGKKTSNLRDRIHSSPPLCPVYSIPYIVTIRHIGCLFVAVQCFPTKKPYIQWLFCGKRPATSGILSQVESYIVRWFF